MPLTRDDIVEKLTTECMLQRREADDLATTFFEDVKKGVEEGKRVKLTGLGVFFLKGHYFQRKRRDIPVDESTPKWRTPSFTPSKKAKARIQYADIAISRDVD